LSIMCVNSGAGTAHAKKGRRIDGSPAWKHEGCLYEVRLEDVHFSGGLGA